MAGIEIKPSPWMRLRVVLVIACAGAISLLLIYLLTGGGGEVFARRAQLITYIPNAYGLTTISPVRLSGVVIGEVERVELSGINDPGRAVRVLMNVKERYLKAIPSDSVTSVRADNLVGDKFVYITEGKSGQSARGGTELATEPVRQAVDNADLIATLENNLRQIDILLEQVSSPESKVGNLILTDDYYRTILSRVTGFNSGLHTVLNPRSDLGKAFYTMDAYRDMLAPVQKFDAQLQAMQRGEGRLGQAFVSDKQYTDALASLRRFRNALADARAGKGQLGRLLKTSDDSDRFATMIRRTDAAISTLTAGQGQFAQLLRDPQLYESVNGSLKAMQRLLADVQSNPRKYLRVKVF